MRAWQLPAPGAIDALQQNEVPVPEPAADQVLVRVRAAAVNAADLEVVLGGRFARFMRARRFPLTPGFDFAGVVEQVGAAVTTRRPGDEVFGYLPYSSRNDRGSFAEYLVAHPHELFRKPTGLTFPEAAGAATCGMTAMAMIRHADRINGRRVLVNGATGGVGSMLVQIARAHDAEVWGTTSPGNMAFLKRIGAAVALDYNETTPDSLNRRFQMIADVADRWSFRQTERILRTGGTYVTVKPSLRYVRGKLGSAMSSKSCHAVRVGHATEDFEELVRLLGSRRLKVPLHASYSMDDVPAALRLFRDESVRGKVTIVVSEY